MYEKLASIGLKAGSPWQPDKLDPAVRTALQKGIEVARAEMKKLSEAGVDAGKFFGTRRHVGTNYMDRAMGVYMGIFGNVPKVSVYLSMPTDAAGAPLDGSKAAYTLTFAKGQLPPVKYFWSITMYSIPKRLLVENPIKRYSIGSSTSRAEDEGRRVAGDLRVGSITGQGERKQLAAGPERAVLDGVAQLWTGRVDHQRVLQAALTMLRTR